MITDARIEGDTLFLKWTGELSPSETQENLDVMEGMLAEHPWVFMVVDTRNATAWGRDARKVAIDWPHQGRLATVVQISPNVTIRALSRIVATALKLIGRSWPAKLLFADSEDQARAYVAKRRQELMAQNRPRVD